MAFWSGLEKIFSVSLISTSRPGLAGGLQVEERGVIADASSLLHVVGNDDDGVLLP